MLKTLFSKSIFRQGRTSAPGWKLSRGQSLVELGLTLPLLLLIVAGTVEVTNLLTLYNQLQLGVREGARLAAQGAPDSTVLGVINDSLRNTAVVSSSDVLSVWIVRPTLKTTSSTWNWGSGNKTSWGATESCITLNAGGTPTCYTGGNPITPNMIGTQLWNIQNTSLNDEIFVVLTARYEAQTILNLRMFGSPTGRFPVYAYNVYRQEVTAKTASQLSSGCSVYPIALEYGNVPFEPVEGRSIPAAFNTFGSRDGFGFLGWRLAYRSQADLTNTHPSGSLEKPGNSQTGIPATNTKSYESPLGITNTQLRRGGWVFANTSPSMSALNPGSILATRLNDHITSKRTLRIIVYNLDTALPTSESLNAVPTDSGQNPGRKRVGSPGPAGGDGQWMYQIADFIIVRVTGFDINGNLITFSYVKQDASCGFPQ